MNCLFMYGFCGLGGVETSVINKIKALKNIGINCDGLFLNHTRKKMYCEYPYIYTVPDLTYLRQIVVKDYDYVIIIDFPNFFAKIRGLNINSKFIFESHGSKIPESFIKDITNPKISAIIVPSQFNKKYIQKYNTKKKEIYIVPNTVDTNLFKNRSTNNLEQELGINDMFANYSTSKIIIWIGRMEDDKNPTEFISIAKELLKISGDNLGFLLIGDSYDYQSYKKKLEDVIEVEYRNQFKFIQQIPYEKMALIYSLAANTGGCLVCTSLNESLPMTIIEAMACNCPVVSTNVGGINELISDGQTGKMYEQGNIKEGVNSILELISEENILKREQICKNALERVNKEHSPKKIAYNYKYIFLQCLKSKRWC